MGWGSLTGNGLNIDKRNIVVDDESIVSRPVTRRDHVGWVLESDGSEG